MSFEVVIGIALGLRDDDRFWNIVHPEWGCGLWYAVTTPLLMCQAITLFDGAFTVESFFFRVVEQFDLNNVAGTPTACQARRDYSAMIESSQRHNIEALAVVVVTFTYLLCCKTKFVQRVLVLAKLTFWVCVEHFFHVSL